MSDREFAKFCEDRHRRMSGPRALEPLLADAGLITVEEFARLARLSRRQIDRLRKRRQDGFPTEYELGSGSSKYRRCPRFKLADVKKWLDSRALW